MHVGVLGVGGVVDEAGSDKSFHGKASHFPESFISRGKKRETNLICLVCIWWSVNGRSSITWLCIFKRKIVNKCKDPK